MLVRGKPEVSDPYPHKQEGGLQLSLIMRSHEELETLENSTQTAWWIWRDDVRKHSCRTL